MPTIEMDPHIERALEAFNNHDVDGVVTEFDEDATFSDPPNDEPLGKAELPVYFEELFGAFPDVKVEVKQSFVSSDGAALEWTYTGTHEGSINDIPPTGEEITLPGVSIIAVSDDGITSWTDYWDQQQYAEQLGIM